MHSMQNGLIGVIRIRRADGKQQDSRDQNSKSVNARYLSEAQPMTAMCLDSSHALGAVPGVQMLENPAQLFNNMLSSNAPLPS